MHRNLQRDTRKTRTGVHVHATHLIAAINAGVALQVISAEFHEIARYTRVGPTVPTLPSLSRELADVTAECLGPRKDGTLAFDIVGAVKPRCLRHCAGPLGRLRTFRTA